MKKLMTVIAAYLLASTSYAQAPELKYVGWSDATVTPPTGVLEYDDACKAAFGPNAVWATTLDVMNNPIPILNGATSFAWVKPTPVNTSGNGPVFATLDASGLVLLATTPSIGCHVLQSGFGIGVRANGLLGILSCSASSTAQVACAA